MRLFCLAVLVACVRGGGAMETLYDWSEPIVQFHISNMTSIVANSEYAWLVEFYSSWCGHCQRLAPVYTRFANDVQSWSTKIRVGAIACNDPDNGDMCRVYGIWAYPTFKFIHPHADERYEGYQHDGPKSSEMLRRATVDYLESLDVPPEGLPQLTPYSSVQNLTGSSDPEDLVFAFVEGNGSNPYIARMVIMDFSNVSGVLIGRIQDYDGSLVPTNETYLFQVAHDGNLTLLAQNDRRNISRKGFIEIIQTHINQSIESAAAEAQEAITAEDILTVTEEQTTSPPDGDALPSLELLNKDITGRSRFTLQTLFPKPNVDIRPTESQTTILPETPTTEAYGYIPPVYRQDLVSALYHTLWTEVGLQEIHTGLRYDALRNFLQLLNQYYPGTGSIMEFLQRLTDWIESEEIGVTGDMWREYLYRLQNDVPYFPEENGWAGCEGSEPRFGRYPCGLWRLLHALTVNAYIVNENVADYDPDEVLGAIREYIRYYFTCRECADHFIRHTRYMLDRANEPEDMVWLLWRVHNGANIRLAGDITEDPERPKVVFPTFEMCPACREPLENISANSPYYLRNMSYWNLDEVVNFLVQMYGPENIHEGGLDGEDSASEESVEEDDTQIEQNVEDGNVLFEPRVKRRAKRCNAKVTDWSECSVSCGSGVSTRMSNDNAECILQTEHRLCQMRPCSLAEVPSGSECEPTIQSITMSHYEYEDCTSVMTNQWRYCNRCAGQVCTPTNEMTLNMGFNCGPKQAFFPVQWILECACAPL